jgi:hypothetical protein
MLLCNVYARDRGPCFWVVAVELKVVLYRRTQEQDTPALGLQCALKRDRCAVVSTTLRHIMSKTASGEIVQGLFVVL